VTRETHLALTSWLKGNLTDRLRTRNSPLMGVGWEHSGLGYAGWGDWRAILFCCSWSLPQYSHHCSYSSWAVCQVKCIVVDRSVVSTWETQRSSWRRVYCVSAAEQSAFCCSTILTVSQHSPVHKDKWQWQRFSWQQCAFFVAF